MFLILCTSHFDDIFAQVAFSNWQTNKNKIGIVCQMVEHTFWDTYTHIAQRVLNDYWNKVKFCRLAKYHQRLSIISISTENCI